MRFIACALIATLLTAGGNNNAANAQTALNGCEGVEQMLDISKAERNEHTKTHAHNYACLIAEIKKLRDRPVLPNGTVIASRIRCEELGTNWQAFKEATGRFLIGAGDEYLRAYRQWRPEESVASKNLTKYDSLSIGGEEQHILSEPEMPSHSHTWSGSRVATYSGVPDASTADNLGVGGSNLYGRYTPSGLSDDKGGDQPHNNMPPYLAVYFCEMRGR